MAGAWYELLLAVLAVWRVTHLLHAEDGPWDAVVRLRGWAGDGFLGRMMDCFSIRWTRPPCGRCPNCAAWPENLPYVSLRATRKPTMSLASTAE